MGKLSVVINTINEAQGLAELIKSVSWADEILVCDMRSEDETVSVAKKLGAKVVYHQRINFVEPARNFAISKASGDWILVMDPDEYVTPELAKRIQEIVDTSEIDFVEIPRKNIIFGKWMKTAMWWPDYNIRLFKVGKVLWSDKIHRPPQTVGKGLRLEEDEELAIVHNHYSNISQFIERLNRYSDVQAEELFRAGTKFRWHDLLDKPLSEFLGRYFANRGFVDGVHGLALGLLQAFSFLVVYLKLWQKEKFAEHQIELNELEDITKKSFKEVNYWFKLSRSGSSTFYKLLNKLRRSQ